MLGLWLVALLEFGSGVGTCGCIELGDRMAVCLGVNNVVVCSLLGLCHGIRDGTGVVVSLTEAAVGSGGSIELGDLDGIDKGFEFGTVVVGSLL